MKKIDNRVCKPQLAFVNYFVHFFQFSVVSSPSSSAVATPGILVLAALIVVVILAAATVVLGRSLVKLLVLICLLMRSLIILSSLREILEASSLATIPSSVLVTTRLINKVLLVVLPKCLDGILSVTQMSLRYDIRWILLVIH